MKDQNKEFAYNSVPYGSRVFPLAGADRLATVATLYGLSPARPECCRTLELGCGDGTNLLSMAYVFRESTFLGIDLSQVHIDKAHQGAKRLGLTNVDFLKADISELSHADIGEFDFISAHGLFSWVPEPVRKAVLKLYSSCLTERGVGYISYNVYPGAHLRKMVWEIMRYHASDEADASAKVLRGREIASLIGTAAEEGPYKFAVAEEARRMAERDDANIFHDDFAEVNQPLYFHEFDRMLRDHGLLYVAEADPDTKTRSETDPRALKIVEQIAAEDRIKYEQYLDFLGGRRFRTSIVCREGVKISSTPRPESLHALLFSSDLKCSPESDYNSDATVAFVDSNENCFESGHQLTKRVLKQLCDCSPQALEWNELVPPRSMDNESDTDIVRTNLMLLCYLGLVHARSSRPAFATSLSERPKASEFARFQLESNCRGVTTLTGSNVEIAQPIVRKLLYLLDGSRTRAAQLEELLRELPNEIRGKTETKEQLRDLIDGNLQIFLNLGLLER